jgi:prepilin-type N-terminal cleavage/methylation domain-containing protein/prepilin-type processing-associated H-X9-DG protein
VRIKHFTLHRCNGTGFTLVELIVCLSVAALLLALLLPAVQRAREQMRLMDCQSRLKQIGLALHNYESTHRVYPFGVGADADGSSATYTSADSRRFSAQVQLLPFLDQASLYQRIDFNIPPFAPDTTGEPAVVTGIGPNEPAAQVRVPVFLCPSDFDRLRRPWGPINYRSCSGNTWAGRVGNGMFGQNTAIRNADITDGLSNTAAFSERVRGDDDRQSIDLLSDVFSWSTIWTEDSLRTWCSSVTLHEAALATTQDSTSGMTWLEGNATWTRYNHVLNPGFPSCKNGITWNGMVMTATSRHTAGVNVLFADGRVRFVSENADVESWRAAGSIRGAEKYNFE